MKITLKTIFALLLVAALGLLYLACSMLRNNPVSHSSWDFSAWTSCCDISRFMHLSEDSKLAEIQVRRYPYESEDKETYQGIYLLYPTPEWVAFNIKQFDLQEHANSDDVDLYRSAFEGIMKSLAPTSSSRHQNLSFPPQSQGVTMLRSAKAWSFSGKDDAQLTCKGHLCLYWDAEQKYALFTLQDAEDEQEALIAQEVNREAPYSSQYLSLQHWLSLYAFFSPAIILGIGALMLGAWTPRPSLRWIYLTLSLLLIPLMIVGINKFISPHCPPDALDGLAYFVFFTINAAALSFFIVIEHIHSRKP